MKWFAKTLPACLLAAALLAACARQEAPPEGDGGAVSQQQEVETVTENPAPEDFMGEDFFLMGDIVCINAAGIDWVGELDLSRTGKLLGEIGRTGVIADFREWDATALPVGTGIYSLPDRGEILIAVHGETRIPYMKMLEG